MAAKHDNSTLNVLFDVSFYETILVQNRKVASENIKQLIGKEPYFMCTKCTFDALKKKNHERGLAVWIDRYDCWDHKPIKEYECLKACFGLLQKNDNMIVATADAYAYQQIKKITSVPIIHLKNGKLKLKEHAVYNAVTNESLTLQKRKRHTVDGTVSGKNSKKHKMLNTGVEVSFEGDPVKRKQNNTGASAKANDEERITQCFQQMKRKMMKAEKVISKQAKANKPKISGNMQYFMDVHAYHPPFNVLFDNPFFQLYMLPNRDSVVRNIEELLGDEFVFCHTNCVLRKIHQNCLLDLLLKLPQVAYRCRHVIDKLEKDLECLKGVILEIGLNDSLVLATGDSNFHSFMRKISPIPIIYLRDLDSFEACFEGQTAGRNNIAVSKEKQNECTSANSETTGRNSLVQKMEQESLERKKALAQSLIEQESLEGKKTPAQSLIEQESLERKKALAQSLIEQESLEGKKTPAQSLIEQESLERKKTPAQSLIEQESLERKKTPAQSLIEGCSKKPGKKKSGQKVKRDQELEDFYDSHYS